MDTPSASKRVFTDTIRDDIRASNTFRTSADTSPDLAAKLRETAMRTRKSVTEGYKTNNSLTRSTTPSRIFGKAQSTGTIFSSPYQVNAQRLKRRHSQSELDEEMDDTQKADGDLSVQVKEAPGTVMLLDGKEDRPVKPLRNKSRALMATQSLPLLSELEPGQAPANHGNNSQVEDDWSMDATSFEVKPL